MAISVKIDVKYEPLDQSGRVSEYFNLWKLSNSPLVRWKIPENVSFEIRSKDDEGVGRKIKNNDVTRLIEEDNLYITNLATDFTSSSTEQEEGFAITVFACLGCAEFKNAEKKISKINTNAFLNSVSSNTKIENATPHAQGSNLYIDKNGRKHFIVSYDTRNDKVCGGYLVIFSEPMCDKTTPRVMEVKCNNNRYNHPGSFQIVGDYLFLPVEEYRNDEDDRAPGSEVHVYDLSQLAYDGKFPEKIDWCTLENHRAGALGATDKWITINDQDNLYLYKYSLTFDENEMNPRLRFYMEYIDVDTIEKTQGIGLIKSVSNTGVETGDLYLIGLVTEKDTQDYIYSYKIAIPTGDNNTLIDENKFITKIGCKSVCTEPGNGKTGSESIHLKYGGGVYLPDDDTIVCLGTGREIRTDMKFNFNIFSNIDRVELDCALENIDDTEARASQNFSVLKFSSKTCKIYVYDDKGNAITVNDDSATKLVVRHDILKKDDKDCCDIESEMTIANNLDKTPLYIAHKDKSRVESEDACFLRVVIEGVMEDEKSR